MFSTNLSPIHLKAFDTPLTKDSILIHNKHSIGLCNYPNDGQITIYSLNQADISVKNIYSPHNSYITDAAFFDLNSFNCLSIGTDKIIHIYDYTDSSAKEIFSFDYMDYINDSALFLKYVRWCKNGPIYIMAFSEGYFVIITHTENSNTPLYYRCCTFDNIEQAEFLPFSCNCKYIIMFSYMRNFRER